MNIKRLEVTEEEKKEIINFFKTEHNNTMEVLSKKFGFSGYIIGKIISEYYDLQKTQKK
jgi:hypothetical protein